MSLSFQVAIDCHDPEALSQFWCRALGYVQEPPPAGYSSWDEFADAVGIPAAERNDFAAAIDPDRNGPRLFFHRVPEGKLVKNRVHLDVNAGAGIAPDQRRAAVDRHVALCVAEGASVLREVEDELGRFVVMADPEGNEFCLQ